MIGHSDSTRHCLFYQYCKLRCRYGDFAYLSHSSSSTASQKALKLLEKAATSHPTKEFTLDIVKDLPPTPTQIHTLADNLSLTPANAGKVLLKDGAPNATSLDQLVKLLETDGSLFRRPIGVNWEAGKAVVAKTPEDILKLLDTVEDNKV